DPRDLGLRRAGRHEPPGARDVERGGPAARHPRRRPRVPDRPPALRGERGLHRPVRTSGSAVSARAAACIGLALALAGGCAPRPPLVRAIHARGGPLRAVVREVEAEVFAGAPGRWSWRTTFLYPDRYAWTIFTAAGADHYLFDGAVARAFVDDNPVSVDAAPAAPLRWPTNTPSPSARTSRSRPRRSARRPRSRAVGCGADQRAKKFDTAARLP